MSGYRGMRSLKTLDDSLSYDEQRLAWRRSLPEKIVRELASDYMRGLIDECTHDAYREYERRFRNSPGVPRGAARVIK